MFILIGVFFFIMPVLMLILAFVTLFSKSETAEEAATATTTSATASGATTADPLPAETLKDSGRLLDLVMSTGEGE